MWTLVPRNYLVVGTVVLTSTLAFIILHITHEWPPTMADGAQVIFASAGLAGSICWFLGSLHWTWSLLSKLGLRRWYPDLNGVWVGALHSNFIDPSGNHETIIVMRIDQRWSKIHVSTQSAHGYSSSETIKAFPRIEESRPILWMVYRGDVPKPAKTDVDEFYGTSRAEFVRYSGELKGRYWTNRAWNSEQRLNTAGTFELRRLSMNSSAAIENATEVWEKLKK